MIVNAYQALREDYVMRNLDCDEIITITPKSLGIFKDVMNIVYQKHGKVYRTSMEFPVSEMKKITK